jgi:hypothetical protein
MSDPGSPQLPPAPGPYTFSRPDAGPAPWVGAPPANLRKPAGWPVLAAMTVALLALGVGIAGWFRPAPRIEHPSTPFTPSYTEQQTAEAKRDICNSFRLVRQAISLNSNRTSPNEGDFGSTWAIAANSRLALEAGASYLLDRLSDEPATSSDLAAGVRSLALKFRHAAVVFLAEEPEPTEQEVKRDVEGEITTVDNLCK